MSRISLIVEGVSWSYVDNKLIVEGGLKELSWRSLIVDCLMFCQEQDKGIWGKKTRRNKLSFIHWYKKMLSDIVKRFKNHSYNINVV